MAWTLFPMSGDTPATMAHLHELRDNAEMVRQLGEASEHTLGSEDSGMGTTTIPAPTGEEGWVTSSSGTVRTIVNKLTYVVSGLWYWNGSEHVHYGMYDLMTAAIGRWPWYSGDQHGTIQILNDLYLLIKYIQDNGWALRHLYTYHDGIDVSSNYYVVNFEAPWDYYDFTGARGRLGEQGRAAVSGGELWWPYTIYAPVNPGICSGTVSWDFANGGYRTSWDPSRWESGMAGNLTLLSSKFPSWCNHSGTTWKFWIRPPGYANGGRVAMHLLECDVTLDGAALGSIDTNGALLDTYFEAANSQINWSTYSVIAIPESSIVYAAWTPKEWGGTPPAWALSTAYEVGDGVTAGGILYHCIQSHTSSLLNQPGTGTNWELYWDVHYGDDGLDPDAPGLDTYEAQWVIPTPYSAFMRPSYTNSLP